MNHALHPSTSLAAAPATAGEAASLHVTVRFFAALREQLGVDELVLELPTRLTVAGLRALLSARGADWQAALAPGQPVMSAWQHELVPEDTVLAASGELAFFPPVTGG